ncbi:MAG TPA: DUF1761 domain-containing protein [Ohtaekwangia sp.]|nr:DUF1761 domain-containing protein [Ohtaekwangia sp.]
MTLKINHPAVWTCIVLMHVFGFLWYGPLWGEKWMALVQRDPAEIESQSMSAGIWILNSVSIITPIYLLAWLFTRINIVSGVQGAIVAFLIVFSVHHLPLMNSGMFAGDPYGLAWINGGYYLAWLTVTGFILGAWRKFAS